MLAIIGGTGLTSADTFNLNHKESILTDYGIPSSDLLLGNFFSEPQTIKINQKNTSIAAPKIPVVFLSRHGFKHNIPPHKINYRANIKALKELGVSHIIAVNAVGGITEKMAPGTIVIPDQIIDYSYAREHTFFADKLIQVKHIDFSVPYNASIRKYIEQAASSINLDIITPATYACTQGPRLESIAEIQRLKRDGCDIVGMTSMPEAALAKELNINYASICFVANWAAGLSASEISMQEIKATIDKGMDKIKALLLQSVLLIDSPQKG